MRFRLTFYKDGNWKTVRCSKHMRNKIKGAMIRMGYTLCAIKGGR